MKSIKKFVAVRRIVFCFLLLAFAGRTHAQDTTPVQMYNKLADIFINMTALAKDMSDKYQEYFPARLWIGIKPSRLSLQNYCANNITVLSEMKDVAGSYDLRQALIKLLEMEKELAEVYTNFDEFDENTSADTANEKKHSRESYFTNTVDPQVTVVGNEWDLYISKNGIK